MTFQVEAATLETVSLDGAGRWIRLEPRAACAWREMQGAAQREGYRLELLSGYRSHADQAAIVARKLARGLDLASILQINAYPGFSEHHTGRAVDVGTPDDPPLEESFASTAAFEWLQVHGASFGFHLSYPQGNQHGIVFEPWHWLWSLGEPGFVSDLGPSRCDG